MGCCESSEPPPTVTIIHPPTQYPPPQDPYLPPPQSMNPYPPPPQTMDPYPPPQQSMDPYPPPQQSMNPYPPPVQSINPNVDDPAYKWVHRSVGQAMPHNAISGGHDVDGTQIFVGRAYHEGDMIPAKVIPAKDVAYVSHGGQEHAKSSFEVLVPADFTWEHASHGSVPPNAVIGGQTSDGEPLYVGRVYHNGAQTIGKIQQSHNCIYIPFDGEEMSFKEYEVLVEH